MAINPVPTISSIVSDLSNAPITGRSMNLGQLAASAGLSQTSLNQAQADARIEANRSIFTQNHTTTPAKYFFRLEVYDFAFQGVGGGPGSVQGTFLGNFELPIPKGLEDVQEVQYTELDVGPTLGAAATGAMQSGQSVTGAVLNAGGGALMGAGAAATPETLQAIYGLAASQFYTIMLKGPTYKTYSLQFDLAPRTSAESEAIRETIRILRRTAAPEMVGPYGMFWDFPDVVIGTFMPQGNGRDTYMYRFKPAVLSSVRANYAPNGTGFYAETSAPEAVTLTLSFTELEYWLRRDFE